MVPRKACCSTPSAMFIITISWPTVSILCHSQIKQRGAPVDKFLKILQHYSRNTHDTSAGALLDSSVADRVLHVSRWGATELWVWTAVSGELWDTTPVRLVSCGGEPSTSSCLAKWEATACECKWTLGYLFRCVMSSLENWSPIRGPDGWLGLFLTSALRGIQVGLSLFNVRLSTKPISPVLGHDRQWMKNQRVKECW